MATQQDRVLEALAEFVPQESREKVAKLVTSLLDEAVNEIKAQFEDEYNSKLEEGYKVIADKRSEDWKTAEDGYKQAYDIIRDLKARLERQESEFKNTLEEEYEKAYQMILAERNKNDELENSLYETFNDRVKKIKNYIVDKADEFLGKMEEECYEAAMKEVLNDPCLAEHRIAFEKVLDVAKDYLSDEDVMLGTSTKVKELLDKNESLELTKRQLESKNMRLITENDNMHLYLKKTKELIEHNLLTEQNERVEQARKVQGRGNTIAEPEREVLLGEVHSTVTKNSGSGRNDEPQTIAEQWQVLAGIGQPR